MLIRPGRLPDRHPPLPSGQSLNPATTSHHARLSFTGHQQGFTHVHPSGLPFAHAAGMEPAALRLPPELRTPPSPATHVRGRDRPPSTDLELPLNSHASISNPAVHSIRATSRRTANRRCAAVRRNRPAPVSARSTMGLADSKELVPRWDSRATAVSGVGGARPAVCCSAVGGGDRFDRPGSGQGGRLAAGGGDPAARAVVWRGERGAARSRSGARRCGVSRLLASHPASTNVIDSESWQSSNRRWIARGPGITTRSIFRVAAWLASSRTP